MILEDVKLYAKKRCFNVKNVNNIKKITLKMLEEELVIARMVGELSGAERVLKAVINNKEWSKEDIEAELHLFIKDVYNTISGQINHNKKIDIEDVLKIYEYYNK